MTGGLSGEGVSREDLEALKDGILALAASGYPFRQKSAQGQPAPKTGIERRCRTCGASFIGLAPGKTGEAGIWDDPHWYCSVECTPAGARPAEEHP